MFTKTPAATKGKYYVYTLSHPEDGMVFSIDKGAVKARKSLRERIDDHEVEAQQGKKSTKCDIIRAIWAKGLEIQKTKQPVEA